MTLPPDDPPIAEDLASEEPATTRGSKLSFSILPRGATREQIEGLVRWAKGESTPPDAQPPNTKG
jgi:hypothetical protein